MWVRASSLELHRIESNDTTENMRLTPIQNLYGENGDKHSNGSLDFKMHWLKSQVMEFETGP